MHEIKSPSLFIATVLLALLVAVSAAASMLKPTHMMADAWHDANISAMIPSEFGGWKLDPSVRPLAPDPTLAAQLEQVYSETVSRTYRNAAGNKIMLSVAYGKNQRGDGRAHYPEVCYPAQGFHIKAAETTAFKVAATREVRAIQLIATQAARIEPITYWLIAGNQLVLGGFEHKRAIIAKGMQGEIADGLLFRISSINANQVEAFERHKDFTQALFNALRPEDRIRFFGE